MFLHKILTSILMYVAVASVKGVTQDQTSTRPNTLFDDADDIQKQLDNEARDRLKFGRPKTIWVFHCPSQFPEVHTETLARSPNGKRRRAKLKAKISSATATGQRKKDWDYAGQNKWSVVYPNCGGKSQSPIDLPNRGLIKARAGRQLVFSNYDTEPESLTLRDDGKRLILFGSWRQSHRPLLHGGAAHSRRYLFHSLILHWPSEHTIEGFQYPMESQVIHISAEYRSLAEATEAASRDPLAILIISNLYTQLKPAGDAAVGISPKILGRYEDRQFGNHTDTCLEELLEISTKIGIGDKSLTKRPLSKFTPPFKEYVAYQGSLTVPPCTESVLWMVRARSLSITEATSKLVRSLYAPGGELRRTLLRQPQPRNDRKIYFFG